MIEFVGILVAASDSVAAHVECPGTKMLSEVRCWWEVLGFASHLYLIGKDCSMEPMSVVQLLDVPEQSVLPATASAAVEPAEH